MPFDETPPEDGGNWWDGGDDPHNPDRIREVVDATLIQLTLNCQANEICPVYTFTTAMIAIARNVSSNIDDALAKGAPPEKVARFRSQLDTVVANLAATINEGRDQ